MGDKRKHGDGKKEERRKKTIRKKTRRKLKIGDRKE